MYYFTFHLHPVLVQSDFYSTIIVMVVPSLSYGTALLFVTSFLS